MINPFTSLRNAWRAAQKRKADCKTALQAIEAGNVGLLESTLAGTSLNRGQEGEVISRAIASDNVGLFEVVLRLTSLKGDVNSILESSESTGPGGSYSSTQKTLLYTAVEEGAANIALSLAQNPAVDITKSGSHYYTAVSHGVKGVTTYFKPPFERAKDLLESEPGLVSVVAVLATRTAGLKREEAAGLDRLATTLKP